MLPDKNVDLQSRNSLAVPSKAEYFYSAQSIQALIDAIAWAKQKHLPVHILGEGSNVLLPEFVSGLVLLPALKGIQFTATNENSFLVDVSAGENWNDFVHYCLQQQAYGLENLTLIPGSVGAAPIQNIGAYGVEVSERILGVAVYDRESEQTTRLSVQECHFGYRDSIFKSHAKNRYVILSVQFLLSKNPCVTLNYPALKQYFAGVAPTEISPQRIAQAVTEIRLSKIPLPEVVPNAGSFFKNPIVDKGLAEKIKLRFPEVVIYPAENDQVKIAAGWLIEQAGWKGKSAFDLRVHSQQALILTNPHRKSLTHILQMAAAIQADVQRLFDLALEIEPQMFCE